MRPEPKFDIHEPIDLTNEAKVAEVIEQLQVSRAELVQAVDAVGSQPVAVAIFLGRSGALEVSRSGELLEDGQEEVFSRTAIELGLDRDPLALDPDEVSAQCTGVRDDQD